MNSKKKTAPEAVVETLAETAATTPPAFILEDIAVPPPGQHRGGFTSTYPWDQLFIQTAEDGTVQANSFFVPGKKAKTFYSTANSAMKKRLENVEGVIVRVVEETREGIEGVRVGLAYGERKARARKGHQETPLDTAAEVAEPELPNKEVDAAVEA